MLIGGINDQSYTALFISFYCLECVFYTHDEMPSQHSISPGVFACVDHLVSFVC